MPAVMSAAMVRYKFTVTSKVRNSQRLFPILLIGKIVTMIPYPACSPAHCGASSWLSKLANPSAQRGLKYVITPAMNALTGV